MARKKSIKVSSDPALVRQERTDIVSTLPGLDGSIDEVVKYLLGLKKCHDKYLELTIYSEHHGDEFSRAYTHTLQGRRLETEQEYKARLDRNTIVAQRERERELQLLAHLKAKYEKETE